MASKVEHARIVNARKPVRRAVTELSNAVKNFEKTEDKISWSNEVELQVSRWAEKAERLRKEITDWDQKLMAAADETVSQDAYDSEYDQCQDYLDRLDGVKFRLEGLRKRFQQPVQAQGTDGPLLEVLTSLARLQEQAQTRRTDATAAGADGQGPAGADIKEVLERLVALQEANTTGAAQLPTAKLKRFSGDHKEFFVFIDEFDRLVHGRTGMSRLQKHKILRDILEGEAARAVRGIPLTEDTYEDTLRYLIQRYGCVETTVFSIFTKMLELQKVHKVSDIGSLRGLLDQVGNYVVTLDSLKLDKQFYCCIMYPILLRTIPEQLSIKFLAGIVDESAGENQSLDDNEQDTEDEAQPQPLNLKITANGDLPQIFASRFTGLLDFLTHEVVTREKHHALCPKDKPDAGQSKEIFKRFRQPPTGNATVYHSATSGDDRRNNGGARQQNLGRQGGSHSSSNREKTSNSGCIFCKAKHASVSCNAEMSFEERRRITRKAGLCWKCFQNGHAAEDCKHKDCAGCKGNHHKLLCRGSERTSSHMAIGSKGLLPTGHVQVGDVSSGTRLARFLLDSGSQRTFISGELSKFLNLKPIAHEWIYVHVLGERAPTEPQNLPIVMVDLRATSGELITLVAQVIPKITSVTLPAPAAALRKKLSNLQLAEVHDGPKELDLLLNAADTCRVTKGERIAVDKNTFVGNTMFGHVIITDPGISGKHALTALAAAPKLDQFWSLESLGISPAELEKPNDSAAVGETFRQGIQRLPDGRYQVKMNLKANIDSLETNKSMAGKQLKNLGSRLGKDSQLKGDYIREMKVFMDGGFAEPLPTGEEPKYVMPHFPVINPDKESYKVRPVFNASAAMRGKLSLNDCIEDTPNLLPCPLQALINFRRYEVALAGDISKAYLMVRVHESHRNFLCFMWFDDEASLTGEKLFRMTSTSFGVKDSQFNTITVIQQHAQLYSEQHPEASKRLLHDLYMDDLLTGADTIEEARQIWEESTAILADAGMTMKKFKSSDAGLRQEFGEETETTRVLLQPPGLAKVLGVGWEQGADMFTFAPEGMEAFVAEAAPTMRVLMGACARLYDPQGLLAPFTMTLKLVLQEAHLEKLRLDDKLPTPLLKRWLQWCDELGLIGNFKIPRTMGLARSERVEIHAFCDASERAYAAVIYLKTTDSSGASTISLVAAKAKLAPLKQLELLTIPKKELMAAMLAVRLMEKVKECLQLRNCRVFLWSDSQVTLHWIYSACPAKWGVFVKNRLSEILEHSKPEQWGHCPGKENPADLPSRGTTMKKLIESPIWLTGPAFLQGRAADYPVFATNQQMQEQMPEARVVCTLGVTSMVDPVRFSTFSKLVRVSAYVRRVVLHCKKKRDFAEQPAAGPLTGQELSVVKLQILRDSQSRSLGEAKGLLARGERVADEQVAAFKPFIDENGLVRVGGRLQFADETFDTRHPILLGDDPVTRLIIADAHESKMMHMKVDAVMNELREKFWIVKMRQLVKTVIHKCARCLRDRAKVVKADEAPLPPGRVEMSFRPFKTTGLDYMGPIAVRTEAGEKKVWVALFTCAMIRAVHLEVVEDLSTAACLAAIRRFVAARGLPALLVTDNALAFRKASQCLTALFKTLNSEVLQNYFGNSGVKWEFNVARAAWWGGFFERMIGVVKNGLRKIMRSQKLPLMNFITIIQEIAAMVNQRPITRAPCGVDELKALTPAQFLAPQVPVVLPAGQLVSLGAKPEGLVKVWKQRERMLNAFWKRWRSEYLLVLRTGLRRKGEHGKALEAGDIVIMQQDGAPRAFWKLGRVESALSSRDGVPRSYKIHLGGGRFVNRPGQLLAKLL